MIALELKNGNVIKRIITAEEIAEIERQAADIPPAAPTAEERIAALEETNAMLTECILELSELLYN